MTLDLASRKTRVLETEAGASTSGLTWAPDGRGVVIGSAGRTRFALLYVPLQGQSKPLDVRRPLVMNPVQANDGKTLMFLVENRNRNLAEAGPSGQPTPVFPSRQRNTFTALSPDGQQLAFLQTAPATSRFGFPTARGPSFSNRRS